MVNKLVAAITQRLNALFGDEYSIYVETIPQGLKPPAFFVQLLQAGSTQIIGNRYMRNHSFDVVLFPAENGTELKQCHDAAAELLEGMEYITAAPDLVFRGTGTRAEVVDEILHFFVQYNFPVLRPVEPNELMEVLDQQGMVKG